MKKFKFTIQGNQYEVEIQNIEDNIATVEVNGTIYEVEVDKTLQPVKTPKLVRTMSVPSTDSTKSTAKTSSPSEPKGSGAIKSPLPVVIIKVHVAVGDTVKLGQKLLTLEAMKMENNILSKKEALIKKLYVGLNQMVEGNAVLVELEDVKKN